MRIFKKLLIVFLALAIIPMAFVSYMFFYNTRNIMEKEILSTLNATADIQAYAIEVFFSERRAGMSATEYSDIQKVIFPMIRSHSLAKSWEALLVKRTPDDKVLFISPLKHDPKGVLTKTVDIGSKYGLPAQEAVAGKSGSGLSVDYHGKEVLSAWRPIKPLGWGFVVKIDAEEAFMPIEKLKRLWSVIVLIAIVSTMFSAFAIARSISEPIRKLHMGSEIIGAGNLDYNVAVDTKDEIGQLSRAFNRMAHSLNAAQQKLVASERLAALGKLTGFISHELRNPLGVMKNAVYYLNMLGLGKGNAGVQDNLNIMSDEIEKSDKIISDLLDFYRVKKPKIEPCEINSVVEQALKRLNIAGGIKLVKELQKDLPEVMADASHIQHVFYNIGKNALEAMGHDGVLTVRTVLAADSVKIYFSDIGCGIAKEDLRKIFEPLVSSKLSGSGLGLAISKTLVESNNGVIEAESETGKGATFIVTLPVR